ncbi:MAG: GNAT family N-acetyltransferase, partial [Christensenellaceae bacterium]
MNAEIDVTGVVLETERLLLRGWKEEDLSDFYEYARVDGVGQMAGWLSHRSMEESECILKRFMEGKKTFALVQKETGKVIGSLGIEEYGERLSEFDPYRGREIGFVLSKAYWGRGYMTEAVQAVIAYLFDEVALAFLLC